MLSTCNLPPLLEISAPACINLIPVHDDPSTPGPQPRGATVVAAGLLLAAFAMVVLYTSRRAFLSPLALVVIAAIGMAALLLQLRLRPGLSSNPKSSRGPLW